MKKTCEKKLKFPTFQSTHAWCMYDAFNQGVHCRGKFFLEGHEEIKNIMSCKISKFLLHKFQKDGGGGTGPPGPPRSAPPAL